jgi:hypothetical protein
VQVKKIKNISPQTLDNFSSKLTLIPHLLAAGALIKEEKGMIRLAITGIAEFSLRFASEIFHQNT